MAFIGGTSHFCNSECDAPNTSFWLLCHCDKKKCTTCNDTGKYYTDKCSNQYKDLRFNTLWDLYDNYKHKNILPFSGSLIDQPKGLFDTFKKIDYFISLRDDILNAEKKQKKKAIDAINKRLSNG